MDKSTFKAKVLYSDKSPQSSIDPRMDDTPSNYNIANGRKDQISKKMTNLINIKVDAK